MTRSQCSKEYQSVASETEPSVVKSGFTRGKSLNFSKHHFSHLSKRINNAYFIELL